MSNPKKIAIIGAGPAGLVTAKTLLRNFPKGTFSPTIFEKRNEIGGLWPTNREQAPDGSGPTKSNVAEPVNPLMRTNLSRFSVGFSDLAWESVFDGSELSMFPQAWQAGKYLQAYAQRYIPDGVIRLGHRVVRTVRQEGPDTQAQWNVYCMKESDKEAFTEQFDFLVVASGFFSNSHIPDIPGLAEFDDRIVHSSSLHKTGVLPHLFNGNGTTNGQVVVIGGSMSGAEAASTLALHLSSLRLASERQWEDYKVHHVSSRPFWTVPYYLPHEGPGDHSEKNDTISFLPLDLVMYDLARRPPGPIEYNFGPVSSEQVTRLNNYFKSLLGNEYENIGKAKPSSKAGSDSTQSPPWTAIGNDYAEFVRSETISTTIGRVNTIHRQKSGLAKIDVCLSDGQMSTLDNVAAIVMATGFTPFGSLSFLPDDILSKLEFTETDPYLPLILDGKGTMHTEIPDLGFVGFYRAPYWGVMEMQARHLAEMWMASSSKNTESIQSATEERQKIRHLRSADPYLNRSQFPMADYTGLMESFSRDLGISRTPVRSGDGEEERNGPVVPVRYPFNQSPDAETEMDVTLSSLQEAFSNPDSVSVATSMAIFRALHGKWNFIQTTNGLGFEHEHEQNVSESGHVRFIPRYPSGGAYEKEYAYEEVIHSPANSTEEASSTRQIVRFADTTTESHSSHITIWNLGVDKDPNSTARFSHGLSLSLPGRIIHNEESKSGSYVIRATGVDQGPVPGNRYDYEFNLNGVGIISWECIVWKGHGEPAIEDTWVRKTRYER